MIYRISTMQAVYVKYLHSGGKQHCRWRSVAHTASCSVASFFIKLPVPRREFLTPQMRKW